MYTPSGTTLLSVHFSTDVFVVNNLSVYTQEQLWVFCASSLILTVYIPPWMAWLSPVCQCTLGHRCFLLSTVPDHTHCHMAFLPSGVYPLSHAFCLPRNLPSITCLLSPSSCVYPPSHDFSLPRTLPSVTCLLSPQESTLHHMPSLSSGVYPLSRAFSLLGSLPLSLIHI